MKMKIKFFGNIFLSVYNIKLFEILMNFYKYFFRLKML